MAGQIALVIVVVALGSRIPVPGLDANMLAEQLAFSPDSAMARLSIFSLGIIPLFTVFAYAEIARLAVPPFARWQAASKRNADRLNLVLRLLALALAALQGHGIATALASMGVMEGSPLAAIVCFVGSTAVLIWLADRIAIPYPGGGFWVVLVVPLLASWPGQLVTWIELTRFGVAAASAWIILGLFMVAATGLVVVASAILGGRTDGEKPVPAIPVAVLLWPPFLAGIAAGYAAALVMTLSPEPTSGSLWLMEAVFIVSTAVLIPLFVYAYSRLMVPPETDAASRNGIRPRLLVIAALQVVICMGSDLLNMALDLPAGLDGPFLIVVVVVMLALWKSVRGGASNLAMQRSA